MLNIFVCTRKKNTTFVENFEYGRKNESVKIIIFGLVIPLMSSSQKWLYNQFY